MIDFHQVTDRFSVSPQIVPEDVAEAANEGFALIINNRPDGEAPDQPPAASIEAAVRANGLDYIYIPIAGRPTPENVTAVSEALAHAKGKVLAFCRSGTRSITAWSMAEAASGTRTRDELVSLSAAAGYDLSMVLPR